MSSAQSRSVRSELVPPAADAPVLFEWIYKHYTETRNKKKPRKRDVNVSAEETEWKLEDLTMHEVMRVIHKTLPPESFRTARIYDSRQSPRSLVLDAINSLSKTHPLHSKLNDTKVPLDERIWIYLESTRGASEGTEWWKFDMRFARDAAPADVHHALSEYLFERNGLDEVKLVLGGRKNPLPRYDTPRHNILYNMAIYLHDTAYKNRGETLESNIKWLEMMRGVFGKLLRENTISVMYKYNVPTSADANGVYLHFEGTYFMNAVLRILDVDLEADGDEPTSKRRRGEDGVQTEDVVDNVLAIAIHKQLFVCSFLGRCLVFSDLRYTPSSHAAHKTLLDAGRRTVQGRVVRMCEAIFARVAPSDINVEKEKRAFKDGANARFTEEQFAVAMRPGNLRLLYSYVWDDTFRPHSDETDRDHVMLCLEFLWFNFKAVFSADAELTGTVDPNYRVSEYKLIVTRVVLTGLFDKFYALDVLKSDKLYNVVQVLAKMYSTCKGGNIAGMKEGTVPAVIEEQILDILCQLYAYMHEFDAAFVEFVFKPLQGVFIDLYEYIVKDKGKDFVTSRVAPVPADSASVEKRGPESADPITSLSDTDTMPSLETTPEPALRDQTMPDSTTGVLTVSSSPPTTATTGTMLPDTTSRDQMMSDSKTDGQKNLPAVSAAELKEPAPEMENLLAQSVSVMSSSELMDRLDDVKVEARNHVPHLDSSHNRYMSERTMFPTARTSATTIHVVQPGVPRDEPEPMARSPPTSLSDTDTMSSLETTPKPDPRDQTMPDLKTSGQKNPPAVSTAELEEPAPEMENPLTRTSTTTIRAVQPGIPRNESDPMVRSPSVTSPAITSELESPRRSEVAHHEPDPMARSPSVTSPPEANPLLQMPSSSRPYAMASGPESAARPRLQREIHKELEADMEWASQVSSHNDERLIEVTRAMTRHDVLHALVAPVRKYDRLDVGNAAARSDSLDAFIRSLYDDFILCTLYIIDRVLASLRKDNWYPAALDEGTRQPIRIDVINDQNETFLATLCGHKPLTQLATGRVEWFVTKWLDDIRKFAREDSGLGLQVVAFYRAYPWSDKWANWRLLGNICANQSIRVITHVFAYVYELPLHFSFEEYAVGSARLKEFDAMYILMTKRAGDILRSWNSLHDAISHRADVTGDRQHNIFVIVFRYLTLEDTVRMIHVANMDFMIYFFENLIPMVNSLKNDLEESYIQISDAIETRLKLTMYTAQRTYLLDNLQRAIEKHMYDRRAGQYI